MVRRNKMLPCDIQEKLEYFDEDKVEVSDSEAAVKEKDRLGKAVVNCKFNKTTIIFHRPDENTLPYLGQKKGAKSCPDGFLFEREDNGAWVLHIMEFKKTINTASIDKSKHQFTMGLYNARALAGFLNIKIKEIFVYSAYRKDMIGSPQALINLRNANLNSKDRATVNDWNQGKCKLEIDKKEVEFEHLKIQLDENGNGVCELKVRTS